MNYGGILHDGMDVTIRLDRQERLQHICSTWPEWSRKLERQHGAPREVTERHGRITSAFWATRSIW